MAPDPIEEPCERIGKLVTFRVVWVYWNTKECSEKGLDFGGGSKNRDGEVGSRMDVCG